MRGLKLVVENGVGTAIEIKSGGRRIAVPADSFGARHEAPVYGGRYRIGGPQTVGGELNAIPVSRRTVELLTLPIRHLQRAVRL